METLQIGGLTQTHMGWKVVLKVSILYSNLEGNLECCTHTHTHTHTLTVTHVHTHTHTHRATHASWATTYSEYLHG